MLWRVLIYCTILSHTAFADPGVWEQLETGTANPEKGVVKSVEPQGIDLIVTIETKDKMGDTVQRSGKLCREPSTQWPDIVQASVIRAKRDQLEEARKSKKTVEFGSTGPFNSCISFIK